MNKEGRSLSATRQKDTEKGHRDSTVVNKEGRSLPAKRQKDTEKGHRGRAVVNKEGRSLSATRLQKGHREREQRQHCCEQRGEVSQLRDSV